MNDARSLSGPSTYALILIATASLGCAASRPQPAAESPPALVIGAFTDDYGARYEVTGRTWFQLPYGRYHVVRWNVRDQYLIAQNDSSNRSAPGRFTRIDWIALPNMEPYTWAFCYSAYDSPTPQAAVAADSVVRRATPKTGCNGHPFSRMRRTAR